MRSISVAAPLFLLGYGVLRWIDGLDGHRKGGPAWNVGHVSFLIAMVLFAAVAVGLARRATSARWLVIVAAAPAVAGAACFVWVTVGDLRAGLPGLPGALRIAGPLLFVLGLIVLLSLQVAGGRVPVWSPILFFFGYAAISLDLDLLPFAAVLILVSFAPLYRRPAGSPRPIPAASRPPL
jgi:hypothetical protein